MISTFRYRFYSEKNLPLTGGFHVLKYLDQLQKDRRTVLRVLRVD